MNQDLVTGMFIGVGTAGASTRGGRSMMLAGTTPESLQAAQRMAASRLTFTHSLDKPKPTPPPAPVVRIVVEPKTAIRKQVAAYLLDHPNARGKEIAAALGISQRHVYRNISALRLGKVLPPKQTLAQRIVACVKASTTPMDADEIAAAMEMPVEKVKPTLGNMVFVGRLTNRIVYEAGI